jgi:hypothetical protein
MWLVQLSNPDTLSTVTIYQKEQIPLLKNDEVIDEDGGQQSEPKVEYGPQTT